jgi:hypothetical protein
MRLRGNDFARKEWGYGKNCWAAGLFFMEKHYFCGD